MSSTTTRRYDVDSVRVYALGLLILYHAVVGFQPWAREINFVTNEQSLEALWIPMGLINVWRIPIVFMVSGMGVCFAMERRTWKPLLVFLYALLLLPLLSYLKNRPDNGILRFLARVIRRPAGHTTHD